MKPFHFFSVKWLSWRFALILLSITLSLELAIVPSLVAHTQAVTDPNNNEPFTPPGDDSPEGDTKGAGTRDCGHCTQDEVAEGTPGFSVLMPVESETIAPRPTFSLYIPETVARKVFFSIKDAEEEYDYQTIITLPKTGSEFSFLLPEDAPDLKTNTPYQWSISLICQQSLDPNDPTLTGVIERVESQEITGNREQGTGNREQAR
ncbi:DUF928 domain-containing protein [Coleofasciculus sp.]|uniref:DUF928 domain-containing protein n=1 Tax=Coleofasciculus sp. TaxID=3100458 RepID=UPI003A28D43B